MNDFGQGFGGSSGTEDLAYQWRASSGYRSEGDGPWTGSYNEPIVLMGARYYMPSMGVFLTRDTDLSQKPYQYCNADPVNNVDPSGHAPGDGLINLSKYIPNPNSNNGNVPDSTTTAPPTSSATSSQDATGTTNSVNLPDINLPSATGNIVLGLPPSVGGSINSGGLIVGGNYGLGGSGSSFMASVGNRFQFGVTAGSGAPVFQVTYGPFAF